MAGAGGGLQKRNRVLYGAQESYHHMCRFFSGFFMLHPLLAEVASCLGPPPPQPPSDYSQRTPHRISSHCAVRVPVLNLATSSRQRERPFTELRHTLQNMCIGVN